MQQALDTRPPPLQLSTSHNSTCSSSTRPSVLSIRCLALPLFKCTLSWHCSTNSAKFNANVMCLVANNSCCQEGVNDCPAAAFALSELMAKSIHSGVKVLGRQSWQYGSTPKLTLFWIGKATSTKTAIATSKEYCNHHNSPTPRSVGCLEPLSTLCLKGWP